MKIPISAIRFLDRKRKEFPKREQDELADSIKRNGLIHPPTVEIVGDGSYILIAGERRTRACMSLGMQDIEVTTREALTELQRKELELEENMHRVDFTDVEKVQAMMDIHRLKQEIYGKATAGVGEGWGIKETAKSVGASVGKVALYLDVASNLDNPAVKEMLERKGVVAAAKEIKRQEEIAVTAMMTQITKNVASLDKHEVANYVSGRFKHMDGRELLGFLPNESVDLVFTDPPYGEDLDTENRWGAEQKVAFQDDPASYFDILSWYVPECARVVKKTGYVVTWCGFSYFHKLKDLFKEAGFRVMAQPFFWMKDCHINKSAFIEQALGYSVECAVFAFKPEATIIAKSSPNYLAAPLPMINKLHPFEKPVELAEYIVRHTCLPSSLVVDPFAGSGNTARAAKKYNCEFMMSEKVEGTDYMTTKQKTKWRT